MEPSTKIFRDNTAEEVDSLPDDALHRDVDLLIKHAVDNDEIGKARVAIVLPSLVYGVGTGCELSKLVCKADTDLKVL